LTNVPLVTNILIFEGIRGTSALGGGEGVAPTGTYPDLVGRLERAGLKPGATTTRNESSSTLAGFHTAL
jgi:hypothetical protein